MTDLDITHRPVLYVFNKVRTSQETITFPLRAQQANAMYRFVMIAYQCNSQ
jgi:hypothetical protein